MTRNELKALDRAKLVEMAYGDHPHAEAAYNELNRRDRSRCRHLIDMGRLAVALRPA